MRAYELMETEFLDDAIIEDLRLDPENVKQRYGTAREFFEREIHVPIYGDLMDGYGNNVHPYLPVISGINAIGRSGVDLVGITSRSSALSSIDEKTKAFVERYFVPNTGYHRVERTRDKEPFLEEVGVWIDDSYASLMPFLLANGHFIVRRRMPLNRNLLSHWDIDDVHTGEQRWVQPVIAYCQEHGVKKMGFDLDDTVCAFKSRIRDVVELFAEREQKLIAGLRGT